MSACTISSQSLEQDARVVYVEVGALLAKNLTGIGRFIARLLETLSQHCSLRLVNMIDGRLAEHMRLSKALPPGQEIAISRQSLPAADADLSDWLKQVLRLP